MGVTRIWTHGNALQVEDTGEYAAIRHRGWGTELQFAGPRDDEDGANLSPRYCHIPLVTPPAEDGHAPTLVKLYVLYKTSGYCHIQRIDVWDGGDAVAQIDQSVNPSVPNGEARGAGSHLTLDPVNQFTIEPYQVSYAVGVTFAMQPIFLPENQPGGPNTDPELFTVTAVGADFEYPIEIATQQVSEKTRVPVPTRTPKKGG